MLDRMSPSTSPATSIASSARVPPQKSPRSDALHSSALAAGRSPADHVAATAGTAWPVAASTDSTAAVRSGRPAPSVAQWTGLPSPAAYASRSASTSGAGGLETTTIELVSGSAARAASACLVERAATAEDRSRPPTPRQWLMPTPAASSRHMTCWAPVPEAATRPTEPGRTTLAKPSATPPTTAVPQSGPMTSTSAAAAASLRRTSSSTGTLSEKTMTEIPARTASSASATACSPGTETSARSAPDRRIAPPSVRAAGASPKPPEPLAAERLWVSAASSAA